ncbi:MAG: DUF4143 domain-containing protein [Deltaproteobacteria bacterium]|nr:DUF4143 domain-containing protein [Deltaproteobacteria bacterium]
MEPRETAPRRRPGVPGTVSARMTIPDRRLVAHRRDGRPPSGRRRQPLDPFRVADKVANRSGTSMKGWQPMDWTDPGIVRAIKRQLGEVHAEERGALFEGFVAQFLRASMDYRGLCDKMYFWAPAQSRDTEVDFLLAAGDRLVAIEAKSGARFSEDWCRGLRAARDIKGLSRRIVVCPAGNPMVTEDGIEVMPLSRLVGVVREGSLCG